MSLRFESTGIALLCLLSVTSLPALAWNDVGHMVSAYIAYQQLTPTVKQKLNLLLRQHPRYEQDLLKDMPRGFADPDLYAFMKSATWPDMIRDFNNPMHNTRHHSNWHYIDFPLVVPQDSETIHPAAPQISGGEVDNILKALTKCNADLMQPDLASSEKAISLCWLAHLTGDLHQPLHATSLFSVVYPQGDRGGNSFFVRANNGDIMNLHALWDQILGQHNTPRVVKLLADNILAHPNYQRKALAEWLEHVTAESWADESFADSREIVYLGLRLRGAVPASMSEGGRGQPPTTAPSLPLSYEAVARQVAEQRVALAGYRLADQISAALSNAK